MTDSASQNTSQPHPAHTKLLDAIVIIRVLVASVFLSEGIQKFLYPDALGVGRFIKIGIPMPEMMAPFVGVVEIVCGLLVVTGLFTRWASILLIIDMIVAILSTKIPLLVEKGFWAMAHEARVDWSMILGLIFLLVVGPGRLSVDSYYTGGRHENEPS